MRPKAKVVRQMLETADEVWLASSGLVERLARFRPDARLVPNGLDERIWAYGSAPPRWQPPSDADPLHGQHDSCA